MRFSLTEEQQAFAKELIARKRPGEITFSSSGLYGASHVPFEMFLQAAGLNYSPLYALPVGGVSDPVFGPTGYFIFKVEEECHGNSAEEGTARPVDPIPDRRGQAARQDYRDFPRR